MTEPQKASSPRALAWEAMLNADYAARYFADLASRYAKRAKLLTLAAAVMASAAFASLLAGASSALAAPWLPAVFTLAAAAVGWWQVVWRYDELARQSASYHRQWGEIHSQARALWAKVDRLDDDELLEAVHGLERQHYNIDEAAASTFSYDRELAEKVFAEMLTANGLPA